jgi:hypothetical protein
MKNNNYHTDRISSLFGRGTSIKSGRVKLELWAQTSPHSEMMWLFMCFQYASNMSTLTYKKTID